MGLDEKEKEMLEYDLRGAKKYLSISYFLMGVSGGGIIYGLFTGIGRLIALYIIYAIFFFIGLILFFYARGKKNRLEYQLEV